MELSALKETLEAHLAAVDHLITLEAQTKEHEDRAAVAVESCAKAEARAEELAVSAQNKLTAAYSQSEAIVNAAKKEAQTFYMNSRAQADKDMHALTDELEHLKAEVSKAGRTLATVAKKANEKQKELDKVEGALADAQAKVTALLK